MQDSNFLKDREMHGENNVWSLVQRYAKELMLGLSQATDHFAMASSVSWNDNVSRIENGLVL